MRVPLEQIPGCAKRAFSSLCKMNKNIEILESEQHMCLDCENNGQALAWETAKNFNIIYGAKLTRNDHSKDSERLHALISMTICAIR